MAAPSRGRRGPARARCPRGPAGIGRRPPAPEQLRESLPRPRRAARTSSTIASVRDRPRPRPRSRARGGGAAPACAIAPHVVARHRGPSRGEREHLARRARAPARRARSRRSARSACASGAASARVGARRLDEPRDPRAHAVAERHLRARAPASRSTRGAVEDRRRRRAARPPRSRSRIVSSSGDAGAARTSAFRRKRSSCASGSGYVPSISIGFSVASTTNGLGERDASRRRPSPAAPPSPRAARSASSASRG